MTKTAFEAGAQISRKAFIQSALILLVLMLVAGIATRIVLAGRYARILDDGREVIDPTTFEFVARPDFLVWRWFTADRLTLCAIIIFIGMLRAEAF